MKKLIVAVFSLVAPILLERIFSGFLEKGIQYMVSNECFYSNWAYRRISEGVRVNLGFYIILILIIYFNIVFVTNHNKKKEKSSKNCKGKCEKCQKNHTFQCVSSKICDWYKHSEGYVAIIAAIWIVTIAFLSLTNFVNHTMIRLTNNIEIVAPYVTDEEYKYLKSDFTLMKNYNDFCELTNTLNKYASDNNVTLK